MTPPPVPAKHTVVDHRTSVELPPDLPPPAPRPPARSRRGWWIAAVAAILVIGGGAVAGSLLLRDDGQAEATTDGRTDDTTSGAATVAARLAVLTKPIAARQQLVARRVDEAGAASASEATRLIRLAATSLGREILLVRGRSESVEPATPIEEAQARAFETALAKHQRYATLLADVRPSTLTRARVDSIERAARAASNGYARLGGTGVDVPPMAIDPDAYAKLASLGTTSVMTRIRLTPLLVMPGQPFRCVSPFARDHIRRMVLLLRFSDGRDSYSVSRSPSDRSDDFYFCGGSTTQGLPGFASGTVRFSGNPAGQLTTVTGRFGADFDSPTRRQVTLLVTVGGRTVCRLSTDGVGHARRFACTGFPQGTTISDLRVGLRVPGDSRYSVFAGVQDLAATVRRSSAAVGAATGRKIPPGPASVGVPAVYDGHFASVDRLQRCYAQGREVWCTSGPSGQRVKLVAGIGVFDEGRTGSRDVGGPSMPEGTSFRTASGRITCSSSFRGISCRDSAGRGFVIGDRSHALYGAGGARVG